MQGREAMAMCLGETCLSFAKPAATPNGTLLSRDARKRFSTHLMCVGLLFQVVGTIPVSIACYWESNFLYSFPIIYQRQ